MGIKHPRLAIDRTERAEVVAIAGAQRHSGIKADLRLIQHQWIGVEASIIESVRHLHQCRLCDGMGTERHGARRLLWLQTVARQKPLAIAIHQRHQRNRHAQHRGSQLHDAIEMGVFRGIEHRKAPQRPEPLLLIGGNRIVGIGSHHSTTNNRNSAGSQA